MYGVRDGGARYGGNDIQRGDHVRVDQYFDRSSPENMRRTESRQSVTNNVQLTSQNESKPDIKSMIAHSVNYHGQQLTSFFKDSAMSSKLDMKKVDYHVYQQRSKTMKLEDRGKRLLIHRFIAQKAEALFQPESGHEHRASLGMENVEDHAAIIPPIEVFSNIDPDTRTKHVLRGLCVGEPLLCKVQNVSNSGLVLQLVAMDPVSGKSRHVEDLKIKGFCPAAEITAGNEYRNEDIVRVAVLEVKPESEKFLAGMRNCHLPHDLQNIVRLGSVQPSDLPITLRYSYQALERGYKYEDFLEKSAGFINPNNVAHLCSELGITDGTMGLLQNLNGKYEKDVYASSLRAAQNKQWAQKHVHLGIKHFKEGKRVEAFQCLNQALNIDQKNVEGLVARGALYANNNSLRKAIDDFEAALQVDPNHSNGKKYMCETLLAVARNYEEDKENEKALETCQRILKLDPGHHDARECVSFLKGRPVSREVDRNLSTDKAPQSGPDDVRRRTATPPPPSVGYTSRSPSPLSRGAGAGEAASLPPHSQPPPYSPFADRSSGININNPERQSDGNSAGDRVEDARISEERRSSLPMSDHPSNSSRPNLHEPPPGYGTVVPTMYAAPPTHQPPPQRDKIDEEIYNQKVEMFLRATQAPAYQHHKRNYRRDDRDRHRSSHYDHRSSSRSRYSSSRRDDRHSSSHHSRSRREHSNSREEHKRGEHSSSSRDYSSSRREHSSGRRDYSSSRKEEDSNHRREHSSNRNEPSSKSMEDSRNKIEQSSNKMEEQSNRSDQSSNRIEHLNDRREESSNTREHSSSRVEESSYRREHSSNKREHSSNRMEESNYRREHSSNRVEESSYRSDHSSNRMEESSYRREHSGNRMEESSYRREHSNNSIDHSSNRMEEIRRDHSNRVEENRFEHSNSRMEELSYRGENLTNRDEYSGTRMEHPNNGREQSDSRMDHSSNKDDRSNHAQFGKPIMDENLKYYEGDNLRSHGASRDRSRDRYEQASRERQSGVIDEQREVRRLRSKSPSPYTHKQNQDRKKPSSPALLHETMKDDDFGKQLRDHLATGKDEKKKKKISQSRSKSKEKKKKEKKKKKDKDRDKDKDNDGDQSVIELGDSDEDIKKSKKKKKKHSTDEKEKEIKEESKYENEDKKRKYEYEEETSRKMSRQLSKDKYRSRSRDGGERRSLSKDRRRKSKSSDRYRKKSRSRSKEEKREVRKKSASKEKDDNKVAEAISYKQRLEKEQESLTAKKGLWIPTGEDSLQESLKNAVDRFGSMRQKVDKSASKFDPHKKISLSSDAPPPAKDYDVTYDPKIGMYIRVPKQKDPTPPAKLSKAEKVAASRKSKMDLESKDDIQLTEERTIRSVKSPESPQKRRSRSKSSSRSRYRRSRSRHRESSRHRHRSRSHGRRHRSRSRSHGRHRSRSRSHGRHRSRSRSHTKYHNSSRSHDKGGDYHGREHDDHRARRRGDEYDTKNERNGN